MDDLINRKAAIEAIKEDKIDLTNPNVVAVFKATGDFEKVETQVMTCDRHIKIIKDLPSAQPDNSYSDGFADGYRRGLIAAQPEIVRCKDCKHNRLPATSGNASCEIYYGMTNKNGFCHMAERREESETDG